MTINGVTFADPVDFWQEVNVSYGDRVLGVMRPEISAGDRSTWIFSGDGFCVDTQRGGLNDARICVAGLVSALISAGGR